jgi:AraC-like DNA-binding protein
MTSIAGDFTSFRFSTEDIPPVERLPTWHEIFGRSVSRRVLTPLFDSLSHVDMTVRTVARSDRDSGTCVQRMFLSGGLCAQRTRELLSDGNDDIVLHVHETGRRSVSQLGREATVEPGGGVLTTNADTSTIVLPEPTRFASIGVPRKVMTASVPALEDALVRPVPPDTGVLQLLMRYLDVLDDEHALRTPALCYAVSTHINDLCALAIGATRDAAEIAKGRGLRAARLRAITAHIAKNIGDGDLSAAALAVRQGVTPRYIHKLFESEGTTLSKFVLGQRLAHVYRMLSDARYSHRTIGALAFDAGFGDLSNFNREFRRHFGATPSDVRGVVR